ncbi:hypothetical protein IWQ60_000798 [Tieghemiomyces parasiticus]|uniref:Uncharacterized protein n=1 Tax=Tieghemiomyces parasiticus TaxID=78921 RepID=A0A9W8AKZ5_9FUNG|nr:hypothetical protein IWQ60_000798 [Tieghemiomyces parasiticus]
MTTATAPFTSTSRPVAVVTGGASGIGKALVARFVGLGFDVAIADVNETLGGEVVAQLNGDDATTDRTAFFRCDVTQPTALIDLLAAVDLRFGHIDVLVNNAGIAQNGEFWASENWRQMVDINLNGTIAGISAAIAYFAPRQRPGAVVNVSSMFGIIPLGSAPVYSATKAAVLSITRAMRDYAPLLGVRVNAVCPAFVDTPMLDGLRKQSDLADAVLSKVNKVPIEDVVDAVMRCVTDLTLAGDAIVIACNRKPTVLRYDTDVEALLAESLPSLPA